MLSLTNNSRILESANAFRVILSLLDAVSEFYTKCNLVSSILLTNFICSLLLLFGVISCLLKGIQNMQAFQVNFTNGSSISLSQSLHLAKLYPRPSLLDYHNLGQILNHRNIIFQCTDTNESSKHVGVGTVRFHSRNGRAKMTTLFEIPKCDASSQRL